MPSLPTQGGNNGTWGDDLNTWLLYDHNTDGSHISSILFDSILGSDTASIDTGASGIAGGYNILDVYIISRTTQAVVGSSMIVRVNNDSGAKYDLQEIRAANTTLAGTQALAQTGWTFLSFGTSAETGAATYLRFSIPGYDLTTFHKVGEGVLSANEDTAAENRLRMHAMRFKDTAAITRMSVTAGSGNLLTGSRLLIYGR